MIAQYNSDFEQAQNTFFQQSVNEQQNFHHPLHQRVPTHSNDVYYFSSLLLFFILVRFDSSDEVQHKENGRKFPRIFQPRPPVLPGFAHELWVVSGGLF